MHLTKFLPRLPPKTMDLSGTQTIVIQTRHLNLYYWYIMLIVMIPWCKSQDFDLYHLHNRNNKKDCEWCNMHSWTFGSNEWAIPFLHILEWEVEVVVKILDWHWENLGFAPPSIPKAHRTGDFAPAFTPGPSCFTEMYWGKRRKCFMLS